MIRKKKFADDNKRCFNETNEILIYMHNAFTFEFNRLNVGEEILMVVENNSLISLVVTSASNSKDTSYFH
jgi:hypothetical protein